MMVTYYVQTLGLQNKVQPLVAFYPIRFCQRTKFLRRAQEAEELSTKKTTALHLWASNKNQLGNRYHGLAPKGSYLERLVDEHHIDPALAPIKGRGTSVFDGALVDELDLEDVQNVADVAGAARSLVLMLHHQYDFDIYMMIKDKNGDYGAETLPEIAEYVEFLEGNGVERDRISIVTKTEDLRPVDMICNLKGFGYKHSIRKLGPILDRCLHLGSRIFMDVKKGSGAFPFLKKYGTNKPLTLTEEKSKSISRIMVTPIPLETSASTGWDDIAIELAGKGGFFARAPKGTRFSTCRATRARWSSRSTIWTSR